MPAHPPVVGRQTELQRVGTTAGGLGEAGTEEDQAGGQDGLRRDVGSRERQVAGCASGGRGDGSGGDDCGGTSVDGQFVHPLSAAIWSAHRSRVRPERTSIQDQVNHAARMNAKSSWGTMNAAVKTSAHV